MTDIAIKVEGLGKKYKIGGRKSGDFRESFGQFWSNIKGSWNGKNNIPSNQLPKAFGTVTSNQQPSTSNQQPLTGNPQLATGNPQLATDFWALKDINFEIKHGEAVGISRNGAGKSF